MIGFPLFVIIHAGSLRGTQVQVERLDTQVSDNEIDLTRLEVLMSIGVDRGRDGIWSRWTPRDTQCGQG